MKLSVITINYNNCIGLKKTMYSVREQNYNDFEYIVIDGASTDDSVELIKAFESSFDKNKMFWQSEPDSGIYNAMNKGISHAKGEYLLFLNSGDYFINFDVLERVFSSSCNADILCARCRVSEKGKVVWTSPLVPDKINLSTLYFSGLMHQSTFIKRDLLIRMGMYDESFRWLADIQFWYKAIIYNDATTQPIDVITSDYNHEGQSSVQKSEMFISESKWPYRQPVLKHIMPDYASWGRERKIVNEFGWIVSHPILRKCLKLYRKTFNC